MSNVKPSDMIQAVTVVPMCAPRMMEMACARVSRPALTNDTVMSVVAVDDWMLAVTNIPVMAPMKRLAVIFCNTLRSCGPAIFCRPSLRVFIPNISSASEPNSVKIVNTFMVSCYFRG